MCQLVQVLQLGHALKMVNQVHPQLLPGLRQPVQSGMVIAARAHERAASKEPAAGLLLAHQLNFSLL